MKIQLIDFNYTGHHTPYDSLISNGLIELNHDVEFITLRSHDRLDEFPSSDNFSVKYAGDSLIKEDLSNSKNFFIGQIFNTYYTYRLNREYNQYDIRHYLSADYHEIPLFFSDYDTQNPHIYTLHQDRFLKNSDNITKSIFRKFSKFSLGKALNKNNNRKLLCHSDLMKHRLITSIPCLNHSNTRVIPAPTPKPPNINQSEARRKLNIDSTNPVVLFFGGLRKSKGPDLLAKSLEDIDKKCTVIFAGKPIDFTKKDVCKWKESASENVKFHVDLEYIPEEKVMLYFLSADILVLPYRRKKGISGPLRRACMAQTFILGTDNSDVGNIIRKNNLGRTFLNESASDLSENLSHMLENIKSIPKDDLEEYSNAIYWKTVVKELEDIYYSLLDRSGSDNPN